MEKHNYIVILAGGGGTRLWPKSRSNTPKQFLRLFNHKTLFQETVERVKSSFAPQFIHVVTNKASKAEIKKEAPFLLDENILIEPVPKNTAAAAGLAAATIAQKDPQAIISTLAADHFIKEQNKFLTVLKACQATAAQEDSIVTIGVVPSHPHTGLGYIHIGKEKFQIGKTSVFAVSSFKEKPDVTTASAYIGSGEHFWNANINTYKASVLLEAIRKYHPSLAKVLVKIGKGDWERDWDKLDPEPIDTAILEKAKNIFMIPGSFSWFDVGDWSTLYSIIASSEKQNVWIGGKEAKHVSFDTTGSLIHGDGKLVATFGLKDLVIIDTPDVLLVCPKGRSQEVKKIVDLLAREKKVKYL